MLITFVVQHTDVSSLSDYDTHSRAHTTLAHALENNISLIFYKYFNLYVYILKSSTVTVRFKIDGHLTSSLQAFVIIIS